jgi:hypothetical protein
MEQAIWMKHWPRRADSQRAHGDDRGSSGDGDSGGYAGVKVG